MPSADIAAVAYAIGRHPGQHSRVVMRRQGRAARAAPRTQTSSGLDYHTRCLPATLHCSYDPGMLCVGYSHMNCLLEAAEKAGVAFQAITLKGPGDGQELLLTDHSRVISDAGLPDFTGESIALLTGSTGPVYSFVGGIRHVRVGLLPMDDPSEPTFDFVLPEARQLPLEPGTEVIPFDGVREIIRKGFNKRMKVLDRLAQLAPGRIVQFAPPPPVSDRWLEPFLEKQSVKATKLPNRLLRWKLWRVAVQHFREHAEALGARFLDCPPEALDADGFMRDELVRNATHGNVAFGGLLLDQVRALR
jgi:hypothetical protein